MGLGDTERRQTVQREKKEGGGRTKEVERKQRTERERVLRERKGDGERGKRRRREETAGIERVDRRGIRGKEKRQIVQIEEMRR